MQTLSDKAIITRAVGSVLSSFVLIAGFILLGVAEPSVQISGYISWLIMFGVLFTALSVGYQVLWVRFYRYEIADNEFRVEKGVISKSYDSIPYSRIQNVGIERSLFQRFLGISTVNIQTAGNSSYGRVEGNIPGIEKLNAERVREEIMDLARQKDGGGL